MLTHASPWRFHNWTCIHSISVLHIAIWSVARSLVEGFRPDDADSGNVIFYAQLDNVEYFDYIYWTDPISWRKPCVTFFNSGQSNTWRSGTNSQTYFAVCLTSLYIPPTKQRKYKHISCFPNIPFEFNNNLFHYQLGRIRQKAFSITSPSNVTYSKYNIYNLNFT